MAINDFAIDNSEETQQITDKSVEIQAYKVAIENLATGRDKSIFTNSGPDHAAIVLANIFRTAKKYIKIYTGRFDKCVSNNEYYMASLKEFLGRDIPLSIIFESDPDLDSSALKLILSTHKQNDKISLKKLIPSYSPMGEFNHFIIADDMMFRAEKINDYSAIGSFNDSKLAKNLNTRFESLDKISNTILN